MHQQPSDEMLTLIFFEYLKPARATENFSGLVELENKQIIKLEIFLLALMIPKSCFF